MNVYEKEQAFLADTRDIAPQDTPLKQGAPVPPPEKPVAPGTKVIRLPEPEMLADHEVSFLEMVELRASVRSYKDTPLSLKELSYLLWCTQGVKMPAPKGGSMRTVPSAGARHAFETYLYIQRIEGLAPGFYRYLAFEHMLLPLHLGEAAGEQFAAAFRAKTAVQESAVTFVWAANIARLAYVFGKRAPTVMHFSMRAMSARIFTLRHGRSARAAVPWAHLMTRRSILCSASMAERNLPSMARRSARRRASRRRRGERK